MTHIEYMRRFVPFKADFKDIITELQDDPGIAIETKALETVKTLCSSGRGLIVLTGNAGHGKTFICREILFDFLGKNRKSEDDASEVIAKLRDGAIGKEGISEDGKTLIIHKDLSDMGIKTAAGLLETALDLACGATFDDVAFVVRFKNPLPTTDAVGLSLGKLDDSRLVLQILKEDFNRIAHLQAVEVVELVLVDKSLRLEAHVDDGVIPRLADDSAFQDPAATEILLDLAAEKGFHVTVGDLVTQLCTNEFHPFFFIGTYINRLILPS